MYIKHVKKKLLFEILPSVGQCFCLFIKLGSVLQMSDQTILVTLTDLWYSKFSACTFILKEDSLSNENCTL